MSTARIQSALDKAFGQQRLVFWYDEAAEWWPEFDEVQMAGIEKVSVQNNELAVKHRVCREAPGQKFLLYFRGQGRPAEKENWLLDLLLAQGPAFSPDRASLALIEAGLPFEFKALTERHLEFFRCGKRVGKLNDWRKPGDTEREVLLKMMAVVCQTEPAVEALLLALLTEMARDRKDRWGHLEKFALAETWWQELGAHFGYMVGAPTLLDFTLSLFQSVTPFGNGASFNRRQAMVFLNRWKDSQEHREAFAAVSERVAGMLNVTATLDQLADVGPLLDFDLYRRVDLRLLADLKDGLLGGKLSPQEVRQRAEAREQLHWARCDPGIKALYRALAVAAEFMGLLPKLELTIESFDAGLQKYASTWWQVDQLYRKFILHATEAGQTTLLEELAARIEGLYANGYLSQLAQRWQEWVDRCSQWTSTTILCQSDFFARCVRAQTAEGRKVFVIVSDALRFEAARELFERVQREDRWTAELEPMLANLPSFTQLGMAALLPHDELEFDARGQTILADGISTAGTESRAKLLAAHTGGRATAITAEDFLLLNSKTDGRELSRANDVVFIYHNAIDLVGDKRDSEHRTSGAVETAIEDIIRLLKKGAAMNVSHFVVTADHGFLYQHEPPAESDFASITEPPGTLKFDRRFIVASAACADPRLKSFAAAELGLKGQLCFAFPKGIQRLRLQGSGSRYVHGGTTLQEIVVPALRIRKERASDVGRVEVDLVRTGQQITTGQVTVTFLQCDPVGEKRLPRELRATFFSGTGVPISESKTLKCDSKAEDSRQRESRVQFIFGHEAKEFNQQEVILRLEEPVAGTSHFAPYREFSFKLRRAFERDFDDL